MVHCSLWTFVCVIPRIFILILIYPCDISTRRGGHRLTFICVVGWRRAIEPALTHVSTPPFGCDLQCHVIKVLCQLWLCTDHNDVVIRILVSLKRIAPIITLLILRIVVVTLRLLLTWLCCMVNGVTEETLVRTIDCGGLGLHERVLQSVA